MTDAPTTHDVGARVEELLARLSSTSAPTLVRQVEELVGLLVDFHGTGLARVVDVVGEQTIRVLVRDPLVASQFELHGLHPKLAEVDACGGVDAADLGERIEGLLHELTATGPPAVVDVIEEIVASIVHYYGCGLANVVDLVDEQAMRALLADHLVAGQLILHDLHPLSTEQRVHAALEKVRPYLGSHAGDVHYRGIDDDGVLNLALAGSCDGCPSSAATVKLAIEKAVEEAAPEIVRVAVAGMVRESPDGGRRLLPISAVGAPAPAPAADTPTWVRVDGLAALGPGAITATRVGPLATVVCNVAGTLYAYADRCPGCGARLAGGRLDDGLLGCAGCGRRYDVRLAGRADVTDRADGAELHLEPLPLLTDNGTVRVAVAAAGS